MILQALSLVAESPVATDGATVTVPSGRILRDCFEIFHASSSGLAKLSIETSNDLFEMDPLVTMEEAYEFKSKRKQWVKNFEEALRELFEKRLAGQRRKGRRLDAEQSLGSLRVMNDSDTSQQSNLGDATKRLMEAAAKELDALDYRVSALFDEPPSRRVDNPFSPAYLLDAIGLTTRSLYAEARIWRPVMERIVSDFVPAINKTYIHLNRFLAKRGVLPEIGAMLRARSDLRPADDGQLVPLFSRLLNEVHPSLQAWRTLDPSAATAASYRLAPLAVNPYMAAVANVPRRSQVATLGAGGFPQLDAMMASGALSAVLETLDYWQRIDPMAEYLRSHAPVGIDAGVTPVNRIPWIQAAIAPQVTDESERSTIDVVGFLFDYIYRDPSIPPDFRIIFDRLQVPILKAALADPSFFADKKHPARRLIDELAGAAVGAEDDEPYGKAFKSIATSIVDTICGEFVIDTDVFERACRTLKKFIDDRHQQMSLAIQPHVDAGLAAELREADRSQVRVLIRDKLAGVDIPFNVRAFIGTVWADYLTRTRQADGPSSDAYTAAAQTVDDMLWSIMVKQRTGQKATLSKMIPSLVRSLRAGGAAVQVTDEKMKRFLDALYELHMAAIKPRGTGADGPLTAASPAPPSLLAGKPIGNVHDFVADIVLGTWLAFDKEGTRVHARLSWISPLRATYIFTGHARSEVMVFTPEELAWEVSAGKAALILEPVPVFDRAVSVTLEYLAEQKAKHDAAALGAAAARSPPPVRSTLATAQL
jgi:Protein of unknown function (DUF1631)